MNRKTFFSTVGAVVVMLVAVVQSTWAQNTTQDPVSYVERSWDATNKQVVSVTKQCTEYTVIGAPQYDHDLFYLDNNKWYVVKDANIVRKGLIIVRPGVTTHLILCDGAKLTACIVFGAGKKNRNPGTIHIYGQTQGTGKLVAHQDIDGRAGIGGDPLTPYNDRQATEGSYDESNHCGTIYFHGGDINAKAEKWGAGIGGGNDGRGGDITVYGGNIYADGGVDAAGIGSGEDGGDGGSLTVYGGTVYADGTGWGAGIGGGEDSKGATVKILGGKVTASAGGDAASKNGCAIGSEDGDGRRGSLTIGGNMMVHAGQSATASNYHLFTAAERVPACFFRPYAVIEPCTHEGATYAINGTDEGSTHTRHCAHCLDRSTEFHTFGTDGKCTVCGAKGDSYKIHLYVPGTADGQYTEANSFDLGKITFTLPGLPPAMIPDGREFAGWLASPNAPSTTTWIAQSGEQLVAAGSSYTVTGEVHFIPRFKTISVTLENSSSNEETIHKYKGKTAATVRLNDRTLYKDGSWNTLVLPFDLSTLSGTPLAGAEMVVYHNSTFDKATGKLTLEFEKTTEIKAGYPVLIKWTSGSNIENPVFENVTIDASSYETVTDNIDFIGTYSPKVIYRTSGTDEVDMTYLYLGSDNKLFTPSTAGFTVNSCRGYFRLKNGLKAGTLSNDVREFTLNFEGETTGISEIENSKSKIENYFNLSGQRVSKPAKGLYIYKGKKVIIK